MDRRMQIYLTNREEYYQNGILMGKWVKLPIQEDMLESVLESMGVVGECQNYFISDYESLLPNLHISEYTSIAELNKLAEQIEGLADHDYEKLAAILECESSMSIAEILEIIDQLDEFDLLTDVHTDEDLGYYYAELCGTFDAVPTHLKSYIDMDRYSYDLKMEINCCFTSYGLVVDNR